MKASSRSVVAAGAALLFLVLPCAAWAQARTISAEAGPIWSQGDAQQKCPGVAKARGGTWDGQWRTTVPGRMSVCEVRLSPSKEIKIVEPIEAGPIWSQSDAESKCAEVARKNGGTWTGHWKTTVPGSMSVCEIRLSG
ncbi:MAG: mannan-binding lectin [Candidatus Cybelea sp.]